MPVEPNSVHAKRDSSGCTPLDTADLQNLPGWQTLAATAATDFGNGAYNLVTNPPQYANYSASVCISTDTIQLTQSGNPSCSTNSQSTASTTVGSDGSVSLTSSPGSAYSAAVTVTQQASIVAGFGAAAPLQIPAVGSTSPSTTVNVPFENTSGQSASATASNQQNQPVSVSSSAGSSCHLNFQTTSCTISGTGQVQYTATGYAWFNYLNVTQGHYKWALSIDDTLPVAQRSSSMNFNAKIQVNTNAQFESACVAGGSSSSSSVTSLTTASLASSGSSSSGGNTSLPATSGSTTTNSQSVLFVGSSGGTSPTSFDSQGGSSTNTASPTPVPSNHSVIIGGAVGGAVGGLLLILLPVCYLRRRQRTDVPATFPEVTPYTPRIPVMPAMPAMPMMTEYPPSSPTDDQTSSGATPLPRKSRRNLSADESLGRTLSSGSSSRRQIQNLQAEVSELRRALDEGRGWADEPPPLYGTT